MTATILAILVMGAVAGTFIMGLLRIALTLFAICLVITMANYDILAILTDTFHLMTQLFHLLIGTLQ